MLFIYELNFCGFSLSRIVRPWQLTEILQFFIMGLYMRFPRG
jgi:hypothetical protein